MKKRVHPLGHTLVVVASNGVWHQPGARRIPRGCALSVAGSLQGPHGTGLPAAPAASRFIDLVRPRGARLPSSAPQAREGWRSPRASIRAAKTPYVNICVALSRPFRCLRFARRPRGTCGSGGRGAARGTPKMGSSRGLSRDFRQSPASRVPSPLCPLVALSARPPAAGPARPAGEAAAPPPAGRTARRPYGLADTVTFKCAIGTASACPVLTSRPSPMVSPTSRGSRRLGSEPCQAPSDAMPP